MAFNNQFKKEGVVLDIRDSGAVITGGGTGGIGFAVAKYRLQQGGKDVLGDAAEEALVRVEKEVN